MTPQAITMTFTRTEVNAAGRSGTDQRGAGSKQGDWVEDYTFSVAELPGNFLSIPTLPIVSSTGGP